MRFIGFSTGALAYENFQEGLRALRQTNATAVELSALRQSELEPLVSAVTRLDLQQFSHVSVHVPSSAEPDFEVRMLEMFHMLPSDWPLITHPNVVSAWDLWNQLGSRLCIENMDKRKPIGRTARELREIFEKLPFASFCLDIGHVHQIDPTMGEAVLLLEEFGHRLRQLHVSEVNSESKHDPISLESASAFSLIARLIPETVPIILESRLPTISKVTIESEMDTAIRILDASIAMETLELAGD